MIELELHSYQIAGETISLYVPDAEQVHQQYHQQKEIDPRISFPYWTRIWPAAKALAGFLLSNSNFIEDKDVLELAAGLGLPSLIAARFAKSVHCSDYVEDAIEVVEKSIRFHQITNMRTSVLDWHHLPENLAADVLLLSDINYEPEEFDVLYKVIERFLANGSAIILSTPQRLMAKPFIEQLLPWSKYQQEIIITCADQSIPTNIFLLQSHH